MKKSLVVILILISFHSKAQTLTGTLKHHSGQEFILTGFDYYKTFELAKTVVDTLGNFTLNYPKNYKGMGIIKTQNNSSLILMLTENNLDLKGTHLQDTDSLQFTNHTENTNFFQYAIAQGQRSNALKAWKYLGNMYKNQKVFSKQKKIKKAIQKEQQRIQKEDIDFVNSLDKNSYLYWFVPVRKLIQEMPVIIRTETERIPEAIAQFRSIDFNNPNFKTSGLFKELLEGHYFMLENMGQFLDSIATQMNLSSQYLIDNLQGNTALLNSVSMNLFNYLEKRSLFKASEYLSVSLLNNNQCILNDDLVAKLESYRKLKVGATAPDIVFANHKKLSELKTTKLVVFGASWCPNCKNDYTELLKQYKSWKAQNVEIVYISIDTDKTAFEAAYKNAPWKTYCDYKGWETQPAKDYYISGTPSYFLLDANNIILVRPNSVSHAKAWIEFKL